MVSVVLEQSNQLFLHVPKVAGGSISRALLTQPDAVSYSVKDMADAIPCVAQIQGQLPRPISSYTTIACVRNPWDWAVSGYLHVTVNRPAFVSPPTFREFLLGDWRLATKRGYPHKFTTAAAYVGYHTQIDQWQHLGGREGIAQIDHVCRFETLAADLADTALPIFQLPHLHRSDRSHYSRYFDEETAELVYRANRALIQTFGYAFEAG